MKKIKFISFLFLTLFMCMCCDPDPVTPDYPVDITTEADLVGYWEFVSLDVPGEGVLTDCNADLVGWMDPWKGKVFWSIEFGAKADVFDKCVGQIRWDKDYNVGAGFVNIGGVIHSFDYLGDGLLKLDIPSLPPSAAGNLTLTLQLI